MDTITAHLDYYVKSFKATLEPSDILPPHKGFEIKKELGKRRQYEKGYLLDCGGYLLLSSDDQQGSLIELSGKPLHELRKNGLTDDDLLWHMANNRHGRRTTRLDYCWNMPHKHAQVSDTLKHWRKGKKITRIKKQPIIYGENDPENRDISPKGMSIYYGSKKAPQRVIVYDKAAEMGLLNKALIRVEMRLRTPYSNLAVSDAQKHNIMAVAQSKLLALLDFPKLQWWQEMYSERVIELSPHKPKAPNAIRFLQGTVDPFIRNNVDDPDFASVLIDHMAQWAQLILQHEQKPDGNN